MKQLGFGFLQGALGVRAGPSPVGAALSRLEAAVFGQALKRYDGDWPWWQRRQGDLFRNEPWPVRWPKAFQRSCRDPVAQSRRGLRSGIVRRHRVERRNREIVNLVRTGYSSGEIAAEYGVTRRTVWRVWRAARWRRTVARRVAERRRLDMLLDTPAGCDTNPLKWPPSANLYMRPTAPPPSGQARSARFAALWRLRDEAARRRQE